MRVRTTMPSLVSSRKFPTFSLYKMSITLRIFSICRGQSCLNPSAKLLKFFESEGVPTEKSENFTEDKFN